MSAASAITITPYTDPYCTNMINQLTAKSVFADGDCIVLENYATTAKNNLLIIQYATVRPNGLVLDVSGYFTTVMIAIIVAICVVVCLCVVIPVAACCGLLSLPAWCACLGCCVRRTAEVVPVVSPHTIALKAASIASSIPV